MNKVYLLNLYEILNTLLNKRMKVLNPNLISKTKLLQLTERELAEHMTISAG